MAMNVEWRNRSQDPIEKRFEDLLEVSTCPLAYEIYNVHPLALQMRMRQSDGDTPTFKDVLKMEAKERSKWYDAMDAELSSLFERDCFDVVPISEARNRQIVPCTWALRKKRRPDGSLIKYKARLCLRGDQMREGLTGNESADEQDGYSPVVVWATTRMMLTVSVKYGLHATQVDFNNAFVQAPLKEPMFMSLPPGFDQQTGHCLRLTKSLYGHKFAAKLFYELLRDTLTDKLGFYVSPSDHCLFIRHDCIIINWVDDQLLLTKDPAVALEIVEAMRKAGFILDVESDSGSIANRNSNTRRRRWDPTSYSIRSH
jgi:hypothetical protein